MPATPPNRARAVANTSRLRSAGIVAGPAIMILLVGGLALLGFRHEQRENAVVAKSHTGILAGRGILTALLNAESATRGYVITGRETYLEPFHGTRGTVDSLMAHLRDLEADDSGLHAMLGRLSALAAARLATLESQIAARRQAGLEAARAEIMTDYGKQLMDSLRVTLAALDEHERQKRATRLAEREDAIALMMALIAATSAAGLALALSINGMLVAARRTEARNAEELLRQNVELHERDTELHAQTEQLQEQAIELETQTKQLEAQTAFFDTILENMTEAVLACDFRGVINFANRAARNLSPVPVDSRDPSRWSERYKFLTLDGEPLPADQLPLRRALSGEQVDGFEFVLAPPAGSPIAVSASARPLPATATSEGGAIVVLRDITAMNEAQARAREAEERARQSQKMEAIGQLAGGIAHDFNNMLTGITSYAQLAFESLPPEHPAAVDVAEIIEAAGRATGLTRQLLAFSRQQVFEPQQLDLNRVVLGSQSFLAHLLGAQAELVVHTAPQPITVEADSAQLEQVVMNLVLNARDALSTRGTITVETAETVLDATAAEQLPGVQPGPHAVLSVSDDGTGMDETTRERLFEPFFTTKEQGRGTGLGLSTVHGIVRQLCGAISVYSEPGVGSTFRIYLPSSGKGPSASTMTPPRQYLSGDETILVVEDEAQIRQLIRRVLEGAGCRVLEAHNGREALAVVQQQPEEIDLVITDVVMPVMGGPEMAETLHREWPALPVMFMSGYTGEALRKQGGWSRNAQLLTKPFTVSQLLRAARDALTT